jgi:hypothetical protein
LEYELRHVVVTAQAEGAEKAKQDVSATHGQRLLYGATTSK